MMCDGGSRASSSDKHMLLYHRFSLPSSLHLSSPLSSMFKKLLGLGQDQKLEFKSSGTNGIARLYLESNILSNDSSYWNRFLQIFDSTQDIFTLLSITDIRKALISNPENIETLFQFLSNHLIGLVESGELSTAATSNTTTTNWLPSIPISASTDGNKRDKIKEALNCVRILTRILPILMEGDHDESTDVTSGSDGKPSLNTDLFETKLLWSRRERTRTPTTQNETVDETPTPAANSSETQFVIQDDEEDEPSTSPDEKLKDDPLGATSKRSEQKPPKNDLEEQKEEFSTLAEDLISLTIDLLFYPGFTIPWTSEQIESLSETSTSDRTSKVNFTIWETGIGSTTPLPSTPSNLKFYESNRIEVLRFLLVLISKSIFIPAHLQFDPSKDNLSLKFLTTELKREKVLPLLCSLLNTVGNFNSGMNGWLNGFQLPGVVSTGLGNGSPNGKSFSDLITLSLEVLNVILGYEPLPPSSPDGLSPSNSSSNLSSNRPPLRAGLSNTSINSTSSSNVNLFRHYLSKLHRPTDFNFMFKGFRSMLDFPFATGLNGMIPIPLPQSSNLSNQPQSQASGETLLLLWKFLTHNPKFRAFIVDSGENSSVLLGQLLTHCLASKDNFYQSGLTRLSIFILQDLSSSKNFGLNLSKSGSGSKCSIPTKFQRGMSLTAENTASDILIQVVYNLIATTKGNLSQLYPPLVLTLTNTSPFWRSLSIASSNRLLSLFKSFSSPNFLLSDEGNPRLLYYLLEAFNYVIQFQFSNNPNFVYALVKNSGGVQKLAGFTLRGGLAEIRRLRSRGGITSPTTASRFPPGTSEAKSKIESPVIKPEGESEMNSADEEKLALAKRDEEELKRVEQLENAGKEIDPLDSTSSNPQESSQDPPPSTYPSEKTRGKMRKVSITSLNDDTNALNLDGSNNSSGGARNDGNMDLDSLIQDLNEDELREASRTVGRNGFVASQQWVASWMKDLPLDTIQLALTELVVKVEQFSTGGDVANKNNADDRVLAFLREQTLLGILPPSPPIHTRPFLHANKASSIWTLSYLWGTIYLSTLYPFGIFANTNVRLLHLKFQESRENRGELALLNASQFVGSLMGGLGGLVGMNGSSQDGNASGRTTSPLLGGSRQTVSGTEDSVWYS